MGRISVLSDTVANRIAAGEVIERPASAVKELVENAIDAGARTIEVSLQEGGRDAILVADDGEGMGADDLLLALERHATSKIQSDSDLEQVRTLGFRGEALPSIASVSRFRITSRDEASAVATVVRVEGGRIAGVTEEAANRGTQIAVDSLFFNVPARRKFLRTADTERQRVAEMLGRYAVAYPQIRFRLVADGRPAFDHAPVGSVYERCAQVFGRAFVDRMIPVEARDPIDEGLAITGLMSGLGETRAHSRDQHLFVNRRPVRDKLIGHAISEAYAESLPRGRHPILVALIEVPSDRIDVNVHPTKSEVRFRDGTHVHRFLTNAIRGALGVSAAAPRAYDVRSSERGDPPPVREGVNAMGPRGLSEPLPRRTVTSQSGESGDSAEPWSFRPEGGAMGLPWSERGRPGQRSGAADSSSRPTVPSRLEGLAPLAATVLGQIRDSYIVAADPGGLILIDQHAAHERVLFETIRSAFSGTRPVAQRLLTPATVDLGTLAEEELARFAEGLVALGFEAEPFGGGTLLVRAVPAEFGDVDPVRLVTEIAADLRDRQAASAPADLARRLAASAACHAAIKAGYPLTLAKMRWLLEALSACETPATCPHGRPAVLRFGLDEIEKGFHRR